MKKLIIAILCIIMLAGCGKSAEIKSCIKGNMKTYYEISDGTWKCNDISYKYRLEIKGRLPNAVKDLEYIYLSNIPEISFERAYKAAGLSSSTNDYFSPEEAVLVELK